MADVNANINIDINSSDALAGLKRLEGQISAFQRSVNSGNAAAIAQQASLNRALMDGINSTGMFAARQVDAIGSSARFTNALEKNKLSLAEYTRFAASQMPGLSRVFRKEFDTMEQVATSRVKAINTQYVALGKSVNGVTKALAATPEALERGYGSQMAIALQRQQMFNKLIDDGSTKLLNWGKNTQWAGRQLMVGLSLPMAAFGAAAASAFMELDKATTQLERVYGDLSTTSAEVERNTEAIKALGSEYTKYGIAVSETIGIGARAAATGATNETLLAATEQTLRFATLGQIDYNQALDTTISLQTAFGISNDQLAQKIDFLNAVENQTILTIEDMSLAIPRVATVVRGLGGDVEDLAVMMTAMREGGVSAENAANGLKSGLASMINPTNAASETLRGLGINLEGIVSQYRGDLMGTITAFAQELDKLSSFERQQALEKTFGKYQYARMSALFDNITSKTGQAARAMDLAGYSAEQLASIAEKELGTIAESTTVKFQASLEQLKLAIAPIGEAFLKIATPAIEVITKIADAFNNLPDPIKNAMGIATVAIAGIGPVILMGIGLMGNLVANVIKGIQVWRRFAASIKGNGDQFKYMTQKEIEAITATESLEGKTTSLTRNLYLQAAAVKELSRQYGRFISAAGIAGAAMASVPAGRGRGGKGPDVETMAKGGVVPGSGSGDKIPALLEPGETVVTKKASQKYGPIIAAMNAGTLPGYEFGLDEGITGATYNPRTSGSAGLQRMSQSLQRYLDTVENGQELQEEINKRLRERSATKPLTNTEIKEIVREVTQQQGMFSNRREGRISMGAPKWARDQSKAMQESDQFDSEKAFIRSRMGEDVPEDWFKIDTSHIEKQVDEFGDKIWTASNLFPDFKKINQTLDSRMKSFNKAINDGTTSISDAAEMMRRQTPELLEGLDASTIEAELDRLRQGIHPVTERATRVATSFAELDAALSRKALEIGQERTALGTVAKTGRNAEFFAAAGQYRLGEGREEYFGAGGRSEQRYQEVSQSSQRQAKILIDDASEAMDKELERNSPAERMARTGDDMDKGLAKGIKRSTPIPVAAARKLADQTAEELDQTIAAKTSQLEKLSAEKTAMKATPTAAGSTISTYSKYPMLLEVSMRELAAQSKEMNDIYTRMNANGASTIQILEAMHLAEMEKRGQLEEQYDAQIRQTKAELEDARITRQTQIEQEKEIAAKKRELAAQQRQSANAAVDAVVTAGGGGGGAGGRGRLGKFFSGGKAGAVGMALGMGSMIPFMAQNEEGKFMGMDANAVGMGMAGAGMALEMGPMLLKLAGLGGIAGKVGVALAAFAGPLAIATAAVAAAGVALYVWRNNVDTAARKAAELGANLGGAANAANKMAEMLGKETPAQREQARLAGFTTEQQEQAQSEFQSIFESDAGKEFIKNLQAATSEQRFSMLADYLKSAIATGMLDKQQAELFGKSIALQIDDPILGVRIGQAIKNQVAGLKGMQDIANQRSSAINKDGAMAAVMAGTAGTEQSSQVIGSSIQAIQDWSNVAALAKDEYNKGLISYQDMRIAVDEATAAQQKYTDSLIKSLGQGDVGGNMQALKTELINTGAINEEGWNTMISTLESTKTRVPVSQQTVSATKGQFNGMGRRIGAIPLNAEDLDQLKGLVVTMIAQGMDPTQATKLGQEIFQDPKIKEKYKGLIEELGNSAAAQVAASDVGKINVVDVAKEAAAKSESGFGGKLRAGAIAADKAVKSNIMLEGIKVDYAKVNGDIRELEAYLAQYSDEELLTIIPRLKTIPPKDRQAFVLDNLKMGEQIGKELADKVQAQKDYSGKEAAAVDEASKVWQGEDLEKIVSIILETTPANLDEVLPQLTGYANKLNEEIPPEIQKIIGIDITNKEDLEKYGPMAEGIGALVPAIESIPEDKREFAANFIFTENGKTKDPIDFARDWKNYAKTIAGLSSDKLSVRKKSSIKLMAEVLGKDGEEISFEEAQTYVSRLIDSLGITEKEFYQLPADSVLKIYNLQTQINGLDEAIAIQEEMAKENPNLFSLQSYAAAQAEKSNLQAQQVEVAAAGVVEGGNDLSSDGGGGGGGKADPFKDFKSGIVTQIQKFADMGVSLKNLMKAKYDFFNILKMSKGIDDKIRKAGLSPLLAEQLMGMDPKEANKILGELTGENGKLTAEGRGLQDRMIAASISGTMSDAQTRAENARQQQNVTRDLVGRGASATAISAITGDPTKLAEYATLLEKAAGGSKKAEKELTKYIATLGKATIAEQAAASATEKAVEVAERRRRISFINTARAGGQEQGLIEYIAGDAGLMAEYTVAVEKGDKAVQAFFDKARKQLKQMQMEAYSMNQFDYIAQQANDAMDAIRTQFEPEQIRLEDESAAKFESSYGMSKDAAQELIDKNNILISQYEQQVNEYERMNAKEQRLIQGHEREKKQWQDKIDAAQNYIDDWQRSIDLLNRQVAERNHQADLLNHELDLMSKAEEQINETYDKRTKALDQVEAVNNRILESQRSQLDMARSLSTGDVYAAAAAAQQMKEQQAQQAATDARDALAAARDAQIQGLRSSGGMSREQIEEQLWQINQQNYQTSLEIYALEDKIYAKNQEIYGYKVEIDKIDKSIKEHTDKIWTNNGEILRIQNDLISPLQDANAKWTDRLRSSDLQLAYDKDHLMYQGKTLKAYEEQNRRINAHMKQLDGTRKLAEGIYGTWLNIGEAIAEANSIANKDLEAARQGNYEKITSVDYKEYLAEDGSFDMDAFINDVNATRQSKTQDELNKGDAAIANNYAGGFISGNGSRDSIVSNLTPGEFVVRKSMVNKYGQAMFEKINQGSFDLPRYGVENSPTVKPVSVSSMTAPVYNNNYSINVPVNQPNASADEIAYKVMTKIKSIDSANIRRINGY